MISADGKKVKHGVVYLIDFGLSKKLSSNGIAGDNLNGTRGGKLAGTPMFASINSH